MQLIIFRHFSVQVPDDESTNDFMYKLDRLLNEWDEEHGTDSWYDYVVEEGEE